MKSYCFSFGILLLACGGSTFQSGGDAGAAGIAGGSNGGANSAGGASAGSTDGGAGASAGRASGGAKNGNGGSETGGTSHGGNMNGGSASTNGGSSNAGTNAGGSAGAGGSLGSLSCQQLQDRYASTLTKAKACSPDATSNPCTQKEAADLFCGCETFVSTQNSDLIDELSALVAEASHRNCAVACPAIACIQPLSSACLVSGTGSYVCTAASATTQ